MNLDYIIDNRFSSTSQQRKVTLKVQMYILDVTMWSEAFGAVKLRFEVTDAGCRSEA